MADTRGIFHFEVSIPRTVYVLDRAACGRLLRALDDFAPEGGDPCRRLREDLRKALAVQDAADGAEAEPGVATEAGQAEAEPGEGPFCAWCGAAGERLPLGKGDTEPLYVCREAGCQREDMPAVRSFFETGYR